jgi:RNA polymerase sigma-70 factor (ECF subfamily)
MIDAASRPGVLGLGEAVPVDDRATDRDRSAVAEVEARHGQAMFGFVRRLGLTDEQAQDCVQEGFLRLLAELQRGVRILDAKAWTYRTIYRIAMDEHRFRRRVAAFLSPFSQRPDAAPERTDATDRITVWREVDRLPTRQRHVIYLRYRADLPFEEIGAILGMTASAARSHATQALQTLRSRLADPGSPDGAL